MLAFEPSTEKELKSKKTSFVLRVFTTSRGMAPECTAFMKPVALRLANKRKDDYTAVANYIRTKIRFALLESVLISLRGVDEALLHKDTLDGPSGVQLSLS